MKTFKSKLLALALIPFCATVMLADKPEWAGKGKPTKEQIQEYKYQKKLDREDRKYQKELDKQRKKELREQRKLEKKEYKEYRKKEHEAYREKRKEDHKLWLENRKKEKEEVEVQDN